MTAREVVDEQALDAVLDDVDELLSGLRAALTALEEVLPSRGCSA